MTLDDLDAAPPEAQTGAQPGAQGEDAVEAQNASALWPGDIGTLHDRSRRALLTLIQGPYLSREREPRNWEALLADHRAIRSSLNNIFLDLVLDTDAEVAFVRPVGGDGDDFPRAVRTQSLTFLDTAMLLALRQRLIAEDRDGRVIVGQDELYEELQVYRPADRDASDFERRLNSSWNKMVNTLRILHIVSAGGDGPSRAEVSPVVRMLIDADRIRAFRATYEQIVSGALPGDTDDAVAGEGDR